MGKFEGVTFQIVFNFFKNGSGNKASGQYVYFPPIFMSVSAAINEINIQSATSYPYNLIFNIRKNENSICLLTLPALYTNMNTTRFYTNYLNVYDQVDVVVHNNGIIKLDNICVNILVTGTEKYSGDYIDEIDIILNSESRRVER